jgi:pimeloyl-ACP methyl ester carboxylesterase
VEAQDSVRAMSGPTPPPELAPGRFGVHRALVRDDVELAFAHEGRGGFPLLLVHGWPETRRIWWRNIEALASAGFEVIAPDLRGFGDSSIPADGFHDLAAHARDLHALVCDVLGHERCAAAGGDLGGGVIIDLGLRHPGFVVRQVLFNCILPILPEAYAAAGIDPAPSAAVRAAADYFVRQGRDADGLARELATAEQRRRYVAGFYGHRLWATPGAFSDRDAAFHAQPFEDADRLRASFGNYESALGTRPPSEPPRFFEPSAVPTVALYGPDDHVMFADFPERCEVAFSDLVGPFVVPRAGHFLQWERADVLNATLPAFCRDLLG